MRPYTHLKDYLREEKLERGLTITEDETTDLRLKSGICLLGRIMSERRIQKEAFRTLMS
jgi:hypothetical protein